MAVANIQKENSPIPIPMPIKGLNTVAPFAITFNSGYARELTNYSIVDGRLTTRPAIRNYAFSNDFSLGRVHWFYPYNFGDAYAIMDNPTGDIVDLNTSTVLGNIGGFPNENAHTCDHSTIKLLFGAKKPRSPSYPFSAWTFTTLSITDTAIVTGCSHKGRLYVTDGNTLEYSSLNQVTGTMKGKYPLTDLMGGQTAIRLFSFSTVPGVEAQNILVIFCSGGRVLAYSGGYPGSADWVLISKIDMPRPISNVGFVEIDGDIWVSTRDYAYWARDLFTKDAQSAYNNSPTIPIENIWKGVSWSSFNAPEVSHAFYEPELDAIITQCAEASSGYTNIGSYAQYDNEGAYFVYFRRYKAWAVWLAPPIFTPVIYPYCTGYDANISQISHGYIQDFIKALSGDQYFDVETSWKTPYMEPNSGRVYKCNGVRPFFEDPDGGYFDKIRAIFNYSDYQTKIGWYTQSMLPPQDPGIFGEGSIELPAIPYNQYQALSGAVGQGYTFSFQFTFKRKTGGAIEGNKSIYGANCYIEDGGQLF